MGLTVSPNSASNIVVSGTTTQAVVQAEQNQTVVSQTVATVEVQQQAVQTVEISAVGPQGPPFAGSTFFDTAAIATLTSSDTGTLLTWDGTKYAPSNVLNENLTIAGGAF
tara:strand:- start:273 stop:602 length:330 start_codon:yes stop_codon:yes gene_type:complete